MLTRPYLSAEWMCVRVCSLLAHLCKRKDPVLNNPKMDRRGHTQAAIVCSVASFSLQLALFSFVLRPPTFPHKRFLSLTNAQLKYPQSNLPCV